MGVIVLFVLREWLVRLNEAVSEKADESDEAELKEV